MVPHPDRTSLGMEYFCDEGDEIWRMHDEDLLGLASSELASLGLARGEEVVDSYVVRQAKAYPVYDQGYEERLATIRSFLGTIGNLQTIGRNGMHRYNNMDHSVLTGILAADNVFGAGHDLWNVNEEDAYLEEKEAADSQEALLESVIAPAFQRMDVLAFATSIGTVAGLMILLATLWLVAKGGDVVGPNLRLLGQYFIGYTVTVRGAFLAFGYAFVWGFLFGWLFAYLRNLLLAFYLYLVKRRAEMLSLRDFLENF